MDHISCMHCASMSIRQHSYLGTLTKLRKAIITFIMSVCPFARPHGTLWTDFHEMLYLRTFRKPVEKILSLI
jgi:hypothetical protein